MKLNSRLFAIMGIIVAAIALITTVTTILVFLGKKKNERELEEYLDCSIQ